MKFISCLLGLSVAILSSAQSSDPSTWPAYASMEMKMLVVVKMSSTMQCDTKNCAGTLNDTALDWIGSSFLNTLPQMVLNMTGGLVHFNTELVRSPTPLTAFAGGIAATNPTVMADDVELFNITVANYDHVFVTGPWQEYGYYTSNSELDGVGWTTVSLLPGNISYPDGCAGLLRETIHANDYWYNNATRFGTSHAPDFGQDDLMTLSPNFNYDANSGGDKGYDVIGAPFTQWNKLYMDWMNGEVCQQDNADAGTCDMHNATRSGLGPEAWKFPTRREVYHGLPAGYLARHRTWPGEPAVKSAYDGPKYPCYIAPRNWSYTDDDNDNFANSDSGGAGAPPAPATSTPTSSSSSSSTTSVLPTSTVTSGTHRAPPSAVQNEKNVNDNIASGNTSVQIQ